MFKNYLKIALRNMKRSKGFTFINIFGLAIGIACSLLILLAIQFEFSYDTFHENYDRLCRVELNYDGRGRLLAFSHVPLGPALQKDYPGIQKYTRFLNMGDDNLFEIGHQRSNEPDGFWADENFFDLFSFRLLQGDPNTALMNPNTMVLSQSLAKKLFPQGNVLGQVIRWNNTFECQVTGVVEDCPANSHIQYQYFVSYTSFKAMAGEDYFQNWNHIANYTYVLLDEKVSVAGFNEKIKDALKTYWRDDVNMPVYLKPMSELHFRNRILGEQGSLGDYQKLWVLGGIGFLILLIACINFMNLSTARFARRSKEVGLRKVVGANRKNLIGQFLGESILFAFLALGLGVLFSVSLLHEFSEMVQKDIVFNPIENNLLMLSMTLLIIVIGLFAGSYPALYLARLKPIQTIKSTQSPGSAAIVTRQILVVFQFAATVVLIASTLIIQNQNHFMRTKGLGFDKEHIVVTEFQRMDPETISQYDALKQELLNYAGVKHISISRFIPSFNGASTIVTDWEGRQDEEGVYINLNNVDKDYLKTFGLSLISGSFFNSGDTKNESSVCVINEKAAEMFGWKDPLGKKIGGEMSVIGVIKDFHFASLQDEIMPMVLQPLNEPRPGSRARNQFSIKLVGGDLQTHRIFIQKKFESLSPNDLFESRFFIEDFEWMYRGEARLLKTIGYFSALAIFVACLGLFGLASFTAEKRSKEMCIRKILGATVSDLTFLLTKSFTKWVFISSLIAWPVTYYFMSRWLQSFAYHTPIGWWIFAVSALIALVIAWLTVIFQSVRVAIVNPVEALKYE